MITDEDSARVFIGERWGREATARLDHLNDLLTAENKAQNLVASNTLPLVYQRHFADSAQLLSHVPRGTTGPWLDLGTGAGFPGLIIAALDVERSVTLVESRSRRVEWLQRASAALKLNNVRIIGARLEALPSFEAAIISARAFAPFVKTLDLASRFSTSETLWLLPKGRSAHQELRSVAARGEMFHVEQSLTDPEAGILIGRVDQKRGDRS